MDRSLTLALVAAFALPLAATAAEPAPPDVPTPEQIEQVTKTKVVESADDVYVGDPLTINAARRRELAYRTLAAALDRPRNDKFEAADTLVCRKQQAVGSHITKTYCATNRTWNYIRKVTTRGVFGMMAPNGPGYELKEGPVFVINPSVLATLGKQFEGDDHEARLAQLAAEDAVARLTDEWNTPAEVISRFARALDQVTRAGKEGDPTTQEAAMARAIAAFGFTVDEYNDLAGRLETSGLFQRRVAAATQALKHELSKRSSIGGKPFER